VDHFLIHDEEDISDASGLTSTLSDNADSVRRAASEMELSIREIAVNTTNAKQVAYEAVNLAQITDENVREFSQSHASIGSVVKVISSIAEQTNLLALNATTEAARAGDAGGQVIRPKMSIGEFGWVSLCMDTEGNVFGLGPMV